MWAESGQAMSTTISALSASRVAVCSWSVLYKPAQSSNFLEAFQFVLQSQQNPHSLVPLLLITVSPLIKMFGGRMYYHCFPSLPPILLTNMPIAAPPPTRAEVKVHTTTSKRRISICSRTISSIILQVLGLTPKFCRLQKMKRTQSCRRWLRQLYYSICVRFHSIHR